MVARLMKYQEKKIGTTQECYMLFWTNPGSSILENSSCSATGLPPHKSQMLGTDGEVSTNILIKTPTYGQPAKTYIHHLCADTRCHLDTRGLTRNNDWSGQMARERQGNLCCQYTVRMMMMMMIEQRGILKESSLLWESL